MFEQLNQNQILSFLAAILFPITLGILEFFKFFKEKELNQINIKIDKLNIDTINISDKNVELKNMENKKQRNIHHLDNMKYVEELILKIYPFITFGITVIFFLNNLLPLAKNLSFNILDGSLLQSLERITILFLISLAKAINYNSILIIGLASIIIIRNILKKAHFITKIGSVFYYSVIITSFTIIYFGLEKLPIQLPSSETTELTFTSFFSHFSMFIVMLYMAFTFIVIKKFINYIFEKNINFTHWRKTAPKLGWFLTIPLIGLVFIFIFFFKHPLTQELIGIVINSQK